MLTAGWDSGHFTTECLHFRREWEFDSIIDKSPSMGADEDNQEASEVTILSVDQPALSLSIPKAWEDIAIIKRQTDIQQSAEARRTVHYSFQLYEKNSLYHGRGNGQRMEPGCLY